MEKKNLVQPYKDTTTVQKTPTVAEQKKDFMIRMVCLVFCGGMLAVHILFIILMSIYNKFETNLTTTMAGPSLPAISLGLLLWSLPFFMHFFFKKYIGIYVLIAYIVFLFCSHFMGTVLDVYDIRLIPSLPNSNWWDKIAHTSWGYLAAVLGLFFLCHMARIEKMNATTVIFFVVGFSALTAVVWEICEFTVDQLLGESAQGDRVTGIIDRFPEQGQVNVIPVNDTMGDIIVHMIGTALFAVQYILHATTKKSFFLTGMKREFSKNCFVKEKAATTLSTSSNIGNVAMQTTETTHSSANTEADTFKTQTNAERIQSTDTMQE